MGIHCVPGQGWNCHQMKKEKKPLITAWQNISARLGIVLGCPSSPLTPGGSLAGRSLSRLCPAFCTASIKLCSYRPSSDDLNIFRWAHQCKYSLSWTGVFGFWQHWRTSSLPFSLQGLSSLDWSGCWKIPLVQLFLDLKFSGHERCLLRLLTSERSASCWGSSLFWFLCSEIASPTQRCQLWWQWVLGERGCEANWITGPVVCETAGLKNKLQQSHPLIQKVVKYAQDQFCLLIKENQDLTSTCLVMVDLLYGDFTKGKKHL